MNLLHGIGVVVLGSLLIGCGGDDDGDGGGSGTNYTLEELAAGACDSQGEESSEQSSECDAYVECAQQQCVPEYEMCLGANYRSGDVSGAV